MEAIVFKECNSVLGKNQPEYKPLPVFIDSSDFGIVVSCYKLTLKERFKLLFCNKLWLSQMTFKKPFQPLLLSVNKNDILYEKL